MMNRPALNMQSILAEEEADQDEGWMISYLDVFVLMTTLFIVLMVIEKPILGDHEQSAESAESAILMAETLNPVQVEQASSDSLVASLVKPVDELSLSMEEAIKKHELGELVQLTRQHDSTELDIASRVLFSSGDSDLTRSGEAVLEKILPVLKATDGLIYVEGHTDDNPIETAKFPSNWELASARATQVLQYFVSEGMAKERFRAVSYADTKPLVPNDSVQNRKRNRRVSLVIQSKQAGHR